MRIDFGWSKTPSAIHVDGKESFCYPKGHVKKAFVVLDELKNVQRFMKLRNPKIGDINLDRLVDESILRELEKSGFLEQALGGKVAAR